MGICGHGTVLHMGFCAGNNARQVMIGLMSDANYYANYLVVSGARSQSPHGSGAQSQITTSSWSLRFVKADGVVASTNFGPPIPPKFLIALGTTMYIIGGRGVDSISQSFPRFLSAGGQCVHGVLTQRQLASLPPVILVSGA